MDGDGVCDEDEVVGCMQLEACNWNEMATDPDDSCEFPGDPCDDGDDTTVNDVLTEACDCAGEVDRVDEFTQWGIALFPTPVNDVMHIRFNGEASGLTALTLTNAAGQTLHTQQLLGNASLDVSRFPRASTSSPCEATGARPPAASCSAAAELHLNDMQNPAFRERCGV